MRIKTNADFHAMLSQSQDFLSLVVKSHYSIDQLLNSTLEEALTNAKSVELKRVSFLLKVDFIIGLGILRPALRPVFNAINSIRNIFAHDPYAEVSHESAQKILTTLRSIKPKVLPDDFCEPFRIRNVLETLFAVGFVSLNVAHKNLCVRKAESVVVSQMAVETVTQTVPSSAANISVEEEYRTRLRLYLSDHYPTIRLD